MNKLFIISFSFILLSCLDDTKTTTASFKTGTFKTVLDDSETSSVAFRNDSLQIETFDNKKDTFHIQWVNNFEYILLHKYPKTMLDSTPFHVKITAVKKESYQFKAYYKGSKFKQKGTAYKIE